MAEVIKTQDENNNPVFEVNADFEDSITLATKDTYVDKNIVFNINFDDDFVRVEEKGDIVSPVPFDADTVDGYHADDFILKSEIGEIGTGDLTKEDADSYYQPIGNYLTEETYKGTVTSVNNITPIEGNVTINIPTVTNDLTNELKQHYDIAYTYSQAEHAPVDAQKNVQSDWNATSGDALILNKPNTISGYGITDAKIENGTITIGNNTITPLTSYTEQYTGTVKSVNNQTPDGNGNITLTIPSITGLATEGYVDTKVSDLVNSAPETLDTLNELASALGNDPNFATTVATEIGKKADSATTLSGYGITDAKIENGTITLGNATITPLTSYTEQYTGTVKSVNGQTPSSNGDVTLTIPPEVTETTVSGWGFTKNTSNLELGETSTTAYRGDRGKTAYDHSQSAHAPADAQKNVQSDWNATSGDALILNKPTTIEGYGITDAKIENGIITLGENTITPLTEEEFTGTVKTVNNIEPDENGNVTIVEGIKANDYLTFCSNIIYGGE